MALFFSKKLKNLAEQVIVITGASSGIGMATALSAAAQGAKVVLVSRNEASLAEVQRRIEDMGGEAIHIAGDVGSEKDVQNIVAETISVFGGFDTWVNCAGVSILGRLEEISDDDNRRLFDTNYWGLVYGSLAAAEHLKIKGGAIINLGSLLSDMSIPIQGMYSASKHAVKGFTDALRLEIDADKSPISVTLVKPAAIATPFFTHAKNYTHHEAKAPPPVYAPEEVAYAILHAAQHPVRDVRVGGSGYAMATLNAHAPSFMDWVNSKFMIKSQFSENPKSRHKNNLHESGEDGSVRGKDATHAMSSIYTRATLNPVVTGLALTAVGVAAYALLGRKGGSAGKTALKTVNTGLGLIMPLQNAIAAKGILKYLEKKSTTASRSIHSNAKSLNKAVNENAKIVKNKTLSLLK
ncbi:MAG: short-chain dehydrogenase [Micavibrio aeruginosavorus]|uniref:Short-chain dehydrogenase n=1 Tax=Micavibrio aeruginosavorus TaxID=349221 RepID=A0A2W5HGL6_9BACT|nr:MAG: short-chain dehydrogenase [Micavibrio aeruginosavorus]